MCRACVRVRDLCVPHTEYVCGVRMWSTYGDETRRTVRSPAWRPWHANLPNHSSGQLCQPASISRLWGGQSGGKPGGGAGGGGEGGGAVTPLANQIPPWPVDAPTQWFFRGQSPSGLLCLVAPELAGKEKSTHLPFQNSKNASVGVHVGQSC